MPDPKDTPKSDEGELDAVSAAYESISKKLEELRQQRDVKDESDEEDESTKLDVDDSDDTPPKKTKDDVKEEVDEEEELEEEDSDDELEPLPGTENKVTGKSQVSLDDEDPLDREEPEDEKPQEDPEVVDEFESQTEEEDKKTFEKDKSDDEMEAWEKQQQETKTFEKEEINDEPVKKAETPEPVDFESRTTSDEGQPDSLDDLAQEQSTLETGTDDKDQMAPTPPPDFDEVNIRQIRPHSRDQFAQQEGYQKPRERNPDQADENYYDRRGPGRRKSSIWQLLILALIGAGVIGGTVYFLKYQFNEEVSPSPSPVVEETISTPSPTPTPPPAITRSSYKVRVLNGTPTSGLAASVSAKLKGLGYQTERTGNATNSAFEKTVIRVKEGSTSASLVDALVKDLAPDFSAGGEKSLRSSEAVDVEVILGER